MSCKYSKWDALVGMETFASDLCGGPGSLRGKAGTGGGCVCSSLRGDGEEEWLGSVTLHTAPHY